jgi:hypothetical protein
MPTRSQLSYEDVKDFLRSYRNGVGEEIPYDVNAIIHLMLAVVDNLRAHWVEGDREQLQVSISEEQRAFLIELSKILIASQERGQ